MPRPVFPVVRLPYDQPDRVARVLDAVRHELKASRRQSAIITAVAVAPTTTAATTVPAVPSRRSSPTMTARVHQQAREPEKILVDEPTGTSTNVYTDQTVVDQVTVGVRECTLTPKVKPEILVTAGVLPAGNVYLDNQGAATSPGSGPYLLVPPVNITAEICRPPLTPQYTS
ncbi:Hypothetical protein CINCED_3A000580 [Cinara cedri]|uniref:Uncharacterized protein n=1 Tax=Cinara cedri TaxID=506608 RepID=A0A5E4NBW0_9HEMI|nr:Hypothetical protein CINCED_3A000580 [Cinara cedri]